MQGQRILRGSPATIRVQFVDQDGQPAAVAGPVTVGVTAADGSVVVAAGGSTVVGANETGVYTRALTPAQTSRLDTLTATWADAATGTALTTTVDVAGGFLFSIPDARSYQPVLADDAKFTDADILRVRPIVEAECERICGTAFVPRYYRETLDGSGTDALTLRWPYPTLLRDAWVWSDATTYTPLTDTQRAAVRYMADGRIRRIGYGWDFGVGNITVGYEHGRVLDAADWALLQSATTQRLRTMLQALGAGSITYERATSLTEDGVTMALGQADEESTGFADIDAVYQKLSNRTQGKSDDFRPASRPLLTEPQFTSLFHRR